MASVRQSTIELLRELDCTTIFGNPGSTELPLFRNLPDDFRYILGLQEAVVVGMADGYAQATGRPAFVNLHTSTGTGHGLGNLFTAFRGQTPMVVTAGQQARSILPFEPFLFADRPTEFPRPFVKWANEPARAADVPRAIARAFLEAMTPPCGPTFVSIPVDDWDKECEPFEQRQMATLNPGDPEMIARLADAISRSRNPCFVLGAGTARDGAWDQVVALAEHHQATVFAGVYASRNVFPENHPLFAGFLPPFREKLVETLMAHDLIVSLGGGLNIYHAEGAGPHLPVGIECWIVCDNPSTLACAPSGMGILANTRSVAFSLLGIAEKRALPRREGRASAKPLRSSPTKLDTTIFDDRTAMQCLSRLLPDDAIVVEEAPTSHAALTDQVRFKQPDRYYSTASGGLGHSMPAAVGISLANPNKRVIAVIGDGSAMYAIQSLHAAHRLGAKMTFIIINNTKYEALRMFGRLFGMQQVVGTDLSGLDFVFLARGHGLKLATRATNADEFSEALKKSFKLDGPSLIEAIVT